MQSCQILKFSKSIVLSIIDEIDYKNFEENLDCFLGQSQNASYDYLGVLHSLSDLLIESHCESNNKPIITYYRVSSSSDTFINLSKSYNNENVIYVAPSDKRNHFVIFYFLNKQKKVLLIDPLYLEKSLDFFKDAIAPFLQKEGYKLYISGTKIQQDYNSCGPSISEITRLLYYNDKTVEDFLLEDKKCIEEGLEYILIDLKSLFSRREFDNLLNSFQTEGTVSYGTVKKKLRGADFRVAQLITAAIIRLNNVEYYALPRLPIVVEHDGIEYYSLPKSPVPAEMREKFRHSVENIRATFIGQIDNVNLFNQEIEKWYRRSCPYYNKTIRELVNQRCIDEITKLLKENSTSNKTNSDFEQAAEQKQKCLEWVEKYMADEKDVNAIGADVKLLKYHQKKLLLSHTIGNQIPVDLEIVELLEEKHPNKGSRKYNSPDANHICSKEDVNQKLLKKNKHNFELTIYHTQGDGNCFFHAVFGDSSFGTCKSEEVASMRREWHKFLSQFESLADTSMPISLKEQLKKVFCFFLDNIKDLIYMSNTIKILADKVNRDIENTKREVSKLVEDIIEKFTKDEDFCNEIYQIMLKAKFKESKEPPRIQTLLNEICVLKDAILNDLEECALKFYPSLTKEQYNKKYNTQVIADLFLESTDIYNSYLQAIQGSSYYVFFEEIPILASLANIKITVYYNDKLQYRLIVFEPNLQLLGGYMPNYEFCGEKKEAIIYYEYKHFSQASVEYCLYNSQVQSISSASLLHSQFRNNSSITGNNATRSAILKTVINPRTSTPVSSLLCDNIASNSASSSTLKFVINSETSTPLSSLLCDNIASNSASSSTILKIVINLETSTPLSSMLCDNIISNSTTRSITQNSSQLQCVNKKNTASKQSYLLLHDAAESGNIDKVKQLIADEYDINARDENGITPLQLAVDNGQEDVVNLLIRKGARVNQANKAGISSIHLAASHGYINIINKLIKNNADVNIQDEDGKTPIHYAAFFDKLDVVECLINNGANVNIQDNYGHTPFNNTKSALKLTPLHDAVREGNISKVKQLLMNGYSADKRDSHAKSPRCIAIENGHMNIFELLVNDGKAESINDNIHYFLKRNQLHNAAEYGDIDLTKKLITRKVNINIEDEAMTTPLHLAARNGHKHIVVLLIANGANVNAENLFGITPLYLAVENSHEYIVDLLIHSGAEVNAKSNANTTSLHLAADSGNVNIVNKLIKNGADTKIKDKNGRTALYYAKRNGHKDNLLIESHDNDDIKEKPSTIPRSHLSYYAIEKAPVKRVTFR